MLKKIFIKLFKGIAFFLKLLFLILRAIFLGIKKLFKTVEKKFSGLNLKIRYKLIILFLIVALPSVIFTLLSFNIVKDTITSQIDSYQKSLVKSSVKITDHYILNCQKSLLNLAEDSNFRTYVRNSNRAALNKTFRRVFKKYKTFSFLGVVGKKDDSLYMKSVYPTRNYSNLLKKEDVYDYMGMNFKNPGFRTSPVFYYNDKREIIIVYPLRGALLIGGIDVAQLGSLLKKTKPMEESNFLLLDSKGNLAVGEKDKKQYVPPEKIKAHKIDLKKSVIYYEGLNVIEGWIGLQTPDIAIYSNITYLTRLFIFFIIFSVGVAFLLALYFSRKVTGPVENLNEGARILGAGNLSYRIDINTGDEIEELSDEFNLMASKLKESYDSLGDKIRIATRDLKDAKEQIEEKNRELQKADRLKSEFLASMSHELRTPINAIIGFTSLMQEGTYGELTEKQKATLSKIMRNTNNLLNLINDILDLSKIEAGRMSLNIEKLKLNKLLKELFEELKPLAEEKGLQFELELDKEIECRNDYVRLKQIVTNLVSNAIKFTKEGKVTIKTDISKDSYSISIIDTGIGIKEDKLETIFDEFVQADGSVTREFGGTGLGLSISKKLVDMMGGKLQIQSKWEEGSTFTVILPYQEN